MFSHMVLEGANRLSNVFEIRKIRTFVLNSLPAVHDVFVLLVQTVIDVMTVIWLVGSKVKGQTGHCLLFSAHFLQAGPVVP